MVLKNYVIRNMNRDDVEIAIDWAADEGWNPGIKDADCFYNSDPHGFFIGELAGKPIGCISAVTYGDSYSFMGFYIVKPEYRGQGYGIQLWKAAMDYLGNRVIGLDGVLAQQNNYIKSGFKTAYHNFRFEGTSTDYSSAPLKEIVDLAALPLADLLSYDKMSFPAYRPEFIRRWIKTGDGAALGYISDMQLKGYGVIRACRNGYKIGPLFADNDNIADAILRALMSRIRVGAPVFLDVPEVNGSALQLSESFKMKPVFETARMYRGEPSLVDLNKIYGVTSLELG
ncbi:MAG: GNAT family N-acetyltransferase [Syntrophomonas sp.]